MEAHVTGTKSGHRNAHSFQSFGVQYVQATATIHQDFGQSSAFDNRVDHQSLPPRGGNVRRVIRLVECDGSLRPLQITGCCRSDHIHLTVNDFQSTFAFDISKNHQGGIDLGVSIVAIFLVLDSVRLFFLILGLLSLELLDQESALSSGMLWVNKITLLIFLGVDVTWQIQNIISILILDFLGLPGAFGFSLEISLGYGQGLPRSGWLGLPLLLSTGIASGFLGDCFPLATLESIFIFSVSVFGGNLHHPIQGHFSGPTELQVQLSVLDAFFKGTNCLVIRYVLNCVMKSDPPLDVIP